VLGFVALGAAFRSMTLGEALRSGLGFITETNRIHVVLIELSM
jgi:hypothetical protein